MSVDDTDGGDTALALKCWDDKDKTLQLYVFAGVDFDQAAKYPPYEVFSFRGDVFKLPVQPNEMDGKLVYVLELSATHKVAASMKVLASTQSRVAVQANSQQFTYDVSASGSAYDDFKKACKLDLSSRF